MSLRINQNVAAFNAYRNLSVTDGNLSKSLEKLSSGFRINRAADDASGLVISEKLRSQINGLKVATRNAQDGISVVQTAEGASQEVHSILQRMRDLALHAANTGSTDADGVAADQAEVDALAAELTRINDTTKFAGNSVFSSTAKDFYVGPNGVAAERISVTTGTVDAATLGVDALDLSTGAAAAVATLDAAIGTVSTLRGSLGAAQNRFEHAIANLQVTQENLTASESRIRDTDMASEMTQFSKTQILMQAGTAMLAQANSVPSTVLALLRG